MRARTLTLLAVALALAGGAAFLVWKRNASHEASLAAPPTPPLEAQPAVTSLLTQVRQLRADPAATPGTAWMLQLHPSGVLRSIGMEPGWSLGTIRNDLPVPSAVRDYLIQHRDAWGLANPRADLAVLRHRTIAPRDVVRLQQTYGGIPVFAAQLVAHVRDASEVTCVVADAALNFSALDAAPLPLVPQVDATDASMRVLAEMLRSHPEAKFDDPDPASARLVVYAPEVLGMNGDAELAWDIEIASRADSPESAAARWIVSAVDGATLNYFNNLHTALSRRIFDFASSTGAPNLQPVRVEGGAAVGIAEVNNAYDFIGQTYNFYSTLHGRDSFDGAGARIDANVRVCQATQCPWTNANSGSETGAMNFGTGYVTDDIVAHEFTHKVTQYESGLLYQNASGAIDESLCDIWGELLDQSNSALTPSGTDTVAVRWLLGEDRAPGGAVRDMRNPPARNDPDRISSAFYQAPVTFPRGSGPSNNDNGGVHSNSGVGNKLCYLLCDGDTFNGLTITALGNNNTLALFYEANTNLLTPASDWLDLNFALRQAAINLGYFSLARANIGAACDAVEINQARHTVHLDISTNAPNKIGIPEVSGDYGPFTTLPTGIVGAGVGGTLKIQGAAGPVQVPANFTFTQPMTIRTYDAIRSVTGTAVTNIPPVPVTILVP